MRAALAATALLWAYRGTLASYLRDQHYQEHFLYLWVFLALALARSLRPPFRRGFAFDNARDRTGLALAALSWLLLAGGEAAGSSSLARTSLVVFATAVAIVAVPGWPVRRCAMHGLLMQLCFGLPYSVYFPLTEKLQWGVAQWVALPARLGLASYVVAPPVVHFTDYDLVITADCAGLGQLLTFVGIAALGVLSSARNRRRTLGLLALAVVLAWLSNLARVSLFVFFVALGWHWTVENGVAHAVFGFLAFLPFVCALVWTILRTHVPLPAPAHVDVRAGRWPVVLLVLPLLLLSFLLARGEQTDFAAPAYFARLEQAPGYRLEVHGPTESADRVAYATPWLLNARFRADDGGWFDLFHYATRSHSHLCVHKVAACLQAPARRLHYEPPVLVDGRAWWRIAIDGDADGSGAHVYFAFEVAGSRFDDSLATQWQVFRERLFGASWEVRFTRVLVPGPMPAAPTAREAAVLTWLGALTASAG